MFAPFVRARAAVAEALGSRGKRAATRALWFVGPKIFGHDAIPEAPDARSGDGGAAGGEEWAR